MFELFEKAALTGLGFFALSQKKTEEFLNELKEKYKMSEDEGKAFLEKMQGMAKENREKMIAMAEEEVKKGVEKLGLVPREEYELLKKRVENLENQCKDDNPGKQC